MSEPRAHHYIPQFYLNGFSTITRKQKTLWVYTIRGAPRKSTPANEAHERDFYAYDRNDKTRYDFERALSNIEGAVAPYLLRICADPKLVPTAGEKLGFAIFVALMFFRVHPGRKFLDKIAADATRTVSQQRAADPDTFFEDYQAVDRAEGWEDRAEKLRQDILANAFEYRQTSTDSNLRSVLDATQRLAPILAAMDWALLHAKGRHEFITSDNPVITIQPEGPGFSVLGSGFDMPGTEVYFPLSAKVCLMMSKESQRKAVGAPRLMDINVALMSASTRHIYTRTFSQETDSLFLEHGCKLEYGVNAFAPAPRQTENR